jgi:hypothetical protein
VFGSSIIGRLLSSFAVVAFGVNDRIGAAAPEIDSEADRGSDARPPRRRMWFSSL